MFFYEKNLSEKKYNSFNENEKYCLINPEWIANFKNYYNYEKFEDLLSGIYKRNNFLNYNNLENYFEKISNELLNYNINIEEKVLLQDLVDCKKINCGVQRRNEILFIFKGFIFPVKIIKLMENILKKENLIYPKELYFKGDKIIYINKPKKIMVGMSLTSNTKTCSSSSKKNINPMYNDLNIVKDLNIY